MAETLSRLGQLFIQSIPTVIFVFLLFAILDRWFFRPVTGILKQREEATLGALARAIEQAAQAEAKSREYEAALQAARQELYRLREADRRAALGERQGMLNKARKEAESRLKEAQANLTQQVDAVRPELQRACQSLALGIAETVLGNGPSADRQGEAKL